MSKFEHLVKVHPCFGAEAHFNKGRIHLPVSPDCNIQCKFCKRGFNKYMERPGNSRKLLNPGESLELVKKALEICPEISVVGIAGPGDTLATDHAIETFAAIHQEFPGLIKCLSTNGLLLYNKAQQLAAVGVDTITVTVNSVDPGIQKKICSHVQLEGEVLIGEAAAQALIQAQLKGIRKVTELGMVVKINIVLVPGINEQTVGDTARAAADAGAGVVNIIPLIPQQEFSRLPAPTCEELNEAREAAGEYLEVFRHCKHCRADACGIPGSGKDLAELFYDQGFPEDTFSHG